MRVTESVSIRRTPAEVFAFASDFVNLPLWDWSIAGVSRTAGPIGVGTRFAVKLRGGLTLDYQVLTWSPPERMVIRAATPTLTSEDTLEVASAPDGARFSYTAELRLAGLRRFSEPFFKPLFHLQGRVILRKLARLLEAA